MKRRSEPRKYTKAFVYEHILHNAQEYLDSILNTDDSDDDIYCYIHHIVCFDLECGECPFWAVFNKVSYCSVEFFELARRVYSYEEPFLKRVFFVESFISHVEGLLAEENKKNGKKV